MGPFFPKRILFFGGALGLGLEPALMSTSNNYDEVEANAATLLANFNLKTRIQQKGVWKHRAANELKSIGRIRL